MKIQLKRSNIIDGGAAKEPTPAQMEYGELAVNYSDTDPAVFIKDSNDNIIRIAGKGANGGTELPDSGGGDHQPGTTDDRYVELTGDNMTGSLTFGDGSSAGTNAYIDPADGTINADNLIIDFTSKFSGATTHESGISVSGGSVANSRPGGIFYSPTNDFIAITTRNYDAANTPAPNGDNAVPVIRLSAKRDYDDNRIRVGGDLKIESLAGGINTVASGDITSTASGDITSTASGDITSTASGAITIETTGDSESIRLTSAQDITFLPTNTFSVSGESVSANQQLFQQTAAAPFNNQTVNVAFYYTKVQDTVFDESDTTTWLSSLNIFSLGLNTTLSGRQNPNVKSIIGLRLGNTLGSSTWSGTGDQFNYGILAQLENAGGIKNFNFAASGTARNYFVGNTGIGNIDPQAKLDVTGQSKFAHSAGGNGASVIEVNRIGNSNGNLIVFREAGVTAGNITLDNAGGVNYNESSDYRLKENVTNIESTVDLIKNLRPVNYNYTSHPGATRQGFIAHELQQSAPLAVTGTKDATEAIGTLADDNGTVLETAVVEPDDLTYTEDVEVNGVTTQEVHTNTWTATGTQPVYQGVDQTKLIPLLTKALQEALDKIESLETRLSDAGIA